jgi:two-component system LytT family response regulator
MKMNKIKAIHIDDEQDSLEVMKLLLDRYCPNVDLVASADTVDKGIELVKIHHPHLVFLDVEMPGKNGFELLEAIPTVNFHTIMVTGYSNYALQAIKYSAIEFLLKPIDSEELINAINKLDPKNLLEDPRLANFSGLVQKYATDYSSLIIASSSGYKKILLEDISHIISETGNYTIFYMLNGHKEVVTKPLSYFEDLLPSPQFCRIHRSHMVNMARVLGYNITSGVVILPNGIELIVSSRKRGDFRRILNVN